YRTKWNVLPPSLIVVSSGLMRSDFEFENANTPATDPLHKMVLPMIWATNFEVEMDGSIYEVEVSNRIAVSAKDQTDTRTRFVVQNNCRLNAFCFAKDLKIKIYTMSGLGQQQPAQFGVFLNGSGFIGDLENAVDKALENLLLVTWFDSLKIASCEDEFR